jgi:xanthine dehydrogenase accessory factor
VIGQVGGEAVVAPFRGLVRGLIAPGTEVGRGAKIGDIDPRTDVAVDEISDKALAIGGGVVEAVLCWLNIHALSPRG